MELRLWHNNSPTFNSSRNIFNEVLNNFWSSADSLTGHQMDSYHNVLEEEVEGMSLDEEGTAIEIEEYLPEEQLEEG